MLRPIAAGEMENLLFDAQEVTSGFGCGVSLMCQKISHGEVLLLGGFLVVQEGYRERAYCRIREGKGC